MVGIIVHGIMYVSVARKGSESKCPDEFLCYGFTFWITRLLWIDRYTCWVFLRHACYGPDTVIVAV